jgi:hypothetical protein
MTDIVEIHWNARPHLARLGIKVGSGPLDPRAKDLFAEIRESVVPLFPGCVTLLRIAVRRGSTDESLRIDRRGAEQDQGHELEAVQALVDSAVARALAPSELQGS